MKNFFLFLRRFSNLILFLGLEVVCVVFIARTNSVQGDQVLSSANAVSGFFYNRQNDTTAYFSLRQANNELLRENASLRHQLSLQMHSTDTLMDTTVRISYANASDSTKTIQYANYIYRTARVINNSITGKNNFITINRGSADGIRPGMAVITGGGVVGKVLNVSTHFATVISVLSDKQPVSAVLPDSNTGLVSWKFGERLRNPSILYMEAPQEAKVKKGDTVRTTSYSFFPPDVPVGTVYKIEKIVRNNNLLLYLRPGANYRKLQYVYVVENTMDAERAALEASNNTQDEKKKRN